MQANRAVIFDMDGVIVDSEPRHEQAFLQVVEEIGHADKLKLCFADFIGRSDRDLFYEFVRQNQPVESLQELIDRKRALTLDILRREEPLFPGLIGLVEKISPHYQLAVASGSERAVIESVLEIQNLKRFFRVSVSAAEVAHGKPAPDIFLRTAELLGVEPRLCWVIEDSKPGIAAGLAAGMKVIAVPNTYPPKELTDATRVARSYEEIGGWLMEEAATL